MKNGSNGLLWGVAGIVIVAVPAWLYFKGSISVEWAKGVAVSGFILIFLYSVVSSNRSPYAQGDKIFKELSVSGKTAYGVVVSLKEGDETRGHSIGMDIEVEYSDPEKKNSTINIFVNRGLIANFLPGKRVWIIYDVNDPKKITINKEKNPVEIHE